MHSITLSNFQHITTTFGAEKGQSYFDAQESLVHEIFTDRIMFYTNFLDHRSYLVGFHEEILSVKKTRLDNYKLHLKATVIEDSMDEEDWEELDQLWKHMVHDLVTGPKLRDLDVRAELEDLFSYLFNEREAEAFLLKLPKKKKPDLEWIWKQISSALEKANRLASFEWKEWVEIGVMEVNNLSPVQQSGIEIPYPKKEDIKEVNNAEEWERALLQYFNVYLDPFELKLLAIGTYFDEHQTFACLSTNNLRLLNAMEKFDKLGVLYKY